jgi:uncharacterized protein YukE
MGTPSSTSYDDAGIDIKVDADRMYQLATQAKNEAIGVHDDLLHIITTLNDLQLSWYGPSQAELNTFNQRWSSATSNLFGTEENPEQGALVKFVVAIALAAQNYGNTEDSVAQMWQKFASALNAPSSNKAPTKDPEDLTEPPITETFG